MSIKFLNSRGLIGGSKEKWLKMYPLLGTDVQDVAEVLWLPIMPQARCFVVIVVMY